MIEASGFIALMGSGELTSTMVEVHKQLLGRLPAPARAVFIDTPAGFQLNCDQISAKAVSFFQERIHHPLEVVSLKSVDATSPFDQKKALQLLKQAAYAFMGPGSPTYAVKQWQQTAVAEILIENIRRGGGLAAASAAALTVGRFTLPVYEIYKVGQSLHWIEGLDLLKAFGLNLVVIPHWNNAEGGTHDTRYCFMGRSRFEALAQMLPDGISILGIDEHTACIIDLAENQVSVKGLGRVILRQGSGDAVFTKGDRFSLDIFRGTALASVTTHPAAPSPAKEKPQAALPENGFWEEIHVLEQRFHQGLESNDLNQVTRALLELDSHIWRAHGNKESDEFISQARELWRDLLVELGASLEAGTVDKEACLAPLIQACLELRDTFRRQQKWDEADAVRDGLQGCGIKINDTPQGSTWQLSD